jgi:predicted Rossmann fold nucleotide-binding protein DprA/Smf involved in DNA uptake
LRVGGRTVAVLGCGLANRYPPEHGELFDAIVAGGGAIVSELPLRTQPRAENFPARNRIVSGLSLGVLVIEASAGSGALITARYACEEHGREVMVVPGRVDSPASEGSLALLKAGEGALVTCARDVLDLLETPARHQHGGTHGPRYAGLGATGSSEAGGTGLIGLQATVRKAVPAVERQARPRPEDPQQCAVLDALAEPGNLDQVQARSGLDASAVRVAITMLELRGDVVRRGEFLARVQ